MLGGTAAVSLPPAQPQQNGQRRLRRVALAIVALAGILVATWFLNRGSLQPWRAGTPRAGGYVVFALPPNQSKGADVAAPKVGAQAPDFTLTGLDGTSVRLSDFRGKTVLLNFWATWCGPCRKEFPELVNLSQLEANHGLVVLAVDVSESRDDVARFAQELGVTFPIVLDSESTVAHSYRLVGLPTSFFVDGDGVVRAQQLGPLTEASLASKLGLTGFQQRKPR